MIVYNKTPLAIVSVFVSQMGRKDEGLSPQMF